MLRNLYIENIAVIREADIDFSSGLTVLSGETGAGKSMIIDALNAILGSRISRELIRTGQNKACVAATFDELSPSVEALCEELGFAPDEGQLLLRREIYADGRNQCRINGQPATLSNLKALGSQLVSIYGHVHENQKAVVNRLARALGHLEKVKRMVEEGYDCSEVLVQLAAVRSALENTGKVILKDHMRHCMVDAVAAGDEDAVADLCEAIDKFMK